MNDQALENDKQAVLAATDIARLIGQHVQLRPNGREMKGLCPFHQDTTPSMNVVPAKRMYHCFACGAGGDAITFVMSFFQMKFVEALTLLADQAGVKMTSRRGNSVPAAELAARAAARPAVVAAAPEVPLMTPKQILEDLKAMRMRAIPSTATAARCAELGFKTEALAMADAFVTKMRGDVLVVPMRKPTGALCSARLRAFDPKLRWSLDRKDQNGEKVLRSEPGLLAPSAVFEMEPKTPAMIVEGETDLFALMSMLLDSHGPDPEKWPVRPIGLPGVNVAHDLLVADIVGKTAWIFVDPDKAGHTAVFDHRWVNPQTGETNIGRERKPGLLSKLKAIGVQAFAAFPPQNPDAEEKNDLRVLYRDGWTWGKLEAYFWEHCTRDASGMSWRTNLAV